MSAASSDREHVLLDLIRQSLDAYDSGGLDIAGLVRDVERVLDTLAEEGGDQSWVEELRTAWSGLEITHAVALDRQDSRLTDAERDEVARKITEIRWLLNSRLTRE
jgi:hypothetical protein